MARAQKGNAFSTDFTSMFSSINDNQEHSQNEPQKETDFSNKKSTLDKESPIKSSPVKEETEEANKNKKQTIEIKKDVINVENKESELIKSKESSPQNILKPVSETVKNPKSIIAAANNETYINVYMTSRDDRDYLKFKSTELDMSTSDFFMSLVKNDSEKIKERKINPNDTNHEEFKKLDLAVSSSIKIKIDEKPILKKNSVRHRLSVQRYCAYIIHEAFVNDLEWY